MYYLCTAVGGVLLYNIGLKFLFGGFNKIAYLCITNLKIGDTHYGNENQDNKSPYGKGK